jgi:hypothetical protein
MLWRASAGFGHLAMLGLLGSEAKAAPLESRAPHFTPRAKRVIFLFMHGGPSQVDTFDYKPLLIRDHGKPLPFARPKVVSSETFNLLKSPWAFKQYGESGAWVSELFPETAKMVDDICFVKSMFGSNSRHGGALLEMHTGSDTFVRPSMGSWITYGLGTENQNMPGYVTVCPTQSHGGANNYSSAFLPAAFAGTAVGAVGVPSRDAKIPFILNKETPRDPAAGTRFIQEMNGEQLAATGPTASWPCESRSSWPTVAERAPELQDISGETDATMYGIDNRVTGLGRQCLMARGAIGARRAVCAGELHFMGKHVTSSAITAERTRSDRPIAGCSHDLKSLGCSRTRSSYGAASSTHTHRAGLGRS